MHSKFILSDPKKCTGCKICELICSSVKEGGFNPLLSRLRSIRQGPTFRMSIACRLCDTPSCVASCARGALSKNIKTGIIVVDEDLCNGCATCSKACELGVIKLHSTKKVAIICDLCDGDPECVKYCPTDALMFTTLEESPAQSRKRLIQWLNEKE